MLKVHRLLNVFPAASEKLKESQKIYESFALAVLMSCGRCGRLEEELDGECGEPGSYELPPCKWCICRTKKMETTWEHKRSSTGVRGAVVYPHLNAQLADYEVGMLDSYLQ